MAESDVSRGTVTGSSGVSKSTVDNHMRVQIPPSAPQSYRAPTGQAPGTCLSLAVCWQPSFLFRKLWTQAEESVTR